MWVLLLVFYGFLVGPRVRGLGRLLLLFLSGFVDFLIFSVLRRTPQTVERKGTSTRYTTFGPHRRPNDGPQGLSSWILTTRARRIIWDLCEATSEDPSSPLLAFLEIFESPTSPSRIYHETRGTRPRSRTNGPNEKTKLQGYRRDRFFDGSLTIVTFDVEMEESQTMSSTPHVESLASMYQGDLVNTFWDRTTRTYGRT